jgi:hypothetical protein
MPREKLINPPDWMIWESGEHVGEPGAWINIIELGGLYRPPNYAEWARFPQVSR